MQFEYFNIPATDHGSEKNSRKTLTRNDVEAAILEAAIERQESRIEKLSNRLRKLEQDETTEIEILCKSIVDTEGESDQACAVYADLNSLAFDIRKQSGSNPKGDDHHDPPSSMEWSETVKKTAARVIQALSEELEVHMNDLQRELNSITKATRSNSLAKLDQRTVIPYLHDFFDVEAQIERSLAIQAQLQCLGYLVWTSSNVIDYRAQIAAFLVTEVPNQNLEHKQALAGAAQDATQASSCRAALPICQKISRAA